MVGITVIPFAIPRFFGLNETDSAIKAHDIVVAVATLLVICAATIWGKKKLRLYNIIIGMLTGYFLSYCFGLFTPEQTEKLTLAGYFALPVPVFYELAVSTGD